MNRRWIRFPDLSYRRTRPDFHMLRDTTFGLLEAKALRTISADGRLKYKEGTDQNIRGGTVVFGRIPPEESDDRTKTRRRCEDAS